MAIASEKLWVMMAMEKAMAVAMMVVMVMVMVMEGTCKSFVLG